MAGHRRGYRADHESRPTRPARARGYWAGQVAAAATSEELFDTGARWLRAVAAKLPEAERTAVLNELGQLLATRADELAHGLARAA